MVSKLVENPSVRLLKHVVRCYLRLSEHMRARDALKHTLPDALRDNTFGFVLVSEEAVQRWLTMLLKNISNNETAPTTSNPSFTSQTGGQVSGSQSTWQH